MALLSVTEIHIKGNLLNHFVSCNLHQEIGEHHSLELNCLHSNLEAFCEKNNVNSFQNLLGETILINSKSYDDLKHINELKFKGVITGLNYKKGQFVSSGDYVIIKAKSTTIIADDGPHYTSYNDMSFKDIIDKNFDGYDSSKLSVNVSDSKQDKPMIYTVQYNESCFKFAQRLASRNGEWMYYDGEELKFGLDSSAKEIELKLGRDLEDYSTTLQPIPKKYNYYTNDYLTNKNHKKASSELSSSSSESLDVVSKSADDMFSKETKFWIPVADTDQSKNRLDEIAKLQNDALTINQVKVTGTADNLGMALAKMVKIDGQNYRITKVIHSFSTNGEYENYFEAVSASIETYPKTNLNNYPKALSQTAKVIENHDPEALGRVKVQFHWQEDDGLTTPWIRTVSASASGGQGFYFVPEIDDEVMVDFEGENAETPYVIGGVYNADLNPPGGSSNADNHIKMFQSRSGSLMMLNDEDGSVTISDKSGSSIVMDGDGSITINAGKNLTINAGEKISFVAASDAELITDAKLSISSASDTSIDAGTKMGITAGTTASVEGGAKTEIKAPMVEVKGDANVKVEGAMVDVNGTGMTNVKGGMVNLN